MGGVETRVHKILSVSGQKPKLKVPILALLVIKTQTKLTI